MTSTHGTGRAALPPGRRGGHRVLTLAACAAVVAAAASATAAHAAEPPALKLHVQQRQGDGFAAASYFRLPARPGRTLNAGRLVLTNSTRHPMKVVLDPVNAQTADTLGFGYALRDERLRGPATWTRLSSRRLRLAPRATAVVGVTASAPSGARPGDHLSGISVQTLGQRADVDRKRRMSVGSVQRYAVGLMLTIPGQRTADVALTGAEVRRRPAGLTFLLAARNTGSALLTGVRGTVVVTEGNRTVLRAPLGPGTFVTDTAIRYPLIAATERPREGARYRVRATLRHAGGTERLDRTVVFGHREAVIQEQFGGPPADRGRGPWWLVAIVAGVVLGVAALALRRRRRAGRPLSPAVTMALLDTEGRDAGPGRPLTVVALRVERLDGDRRAAGLALLAEVRRPADKVGLLHDGRVVVVCPDRGADAAEGAQRELARRLAAISPFPAAELVTAVTIEAPTDSADVLAMLARGSRPAPAWA